MSDHWLVAVHAGAGYHSPARESAYAGVCSHACRVAAKLLQAGASSVDAVVAAVKVLEDEPLCNAGIGSNLTLDGTAECDASVMTGGGLYGGCAAVPGVPNPVELAAALALAQSSSAPKLSLGRVHPMVLCGEGARRWASFRQIPTVPPETLVTPEQRQRWERYMRWLDAAEQPHGDEGISSCHREGGGSGGGGSGGGGSGGGGSGGRVFGRDGGHADDRLLLLRLSKIRRY